MRNELISFDTAVLAKEKGFFEPVNHYYDLVATKYIGVVRRGIDINSQWFNENKEKFILVPTQSLLQKWIRENYHIIVEVRFVGGLTKETAWYDYVIYHTLSEDKPEVLKMEYKTYEQALEVGLQKALELLK